MKRIIKSFPAPYLAAIALTAILLGFFYYAIPFTIDDWGWGSREGWERLLNFFDAYNGRYLGNLFVCLFTRSAVSRVILMPLTVILLCQQMAYYAAKKNSTLFYCLSLLILFGSIVTGFFHNKTNLFDQTLGWTSGFTNYVIPTLLVVVYMNFADRDYRDEAVNHKKYEIPLLLLLGITSGLYLENLTLFCVGMGGGVNLYFFVTRKKKLYASHVSYFIGTVIGAVIMFTNSSYQLVATGKYVDTSHTGATIRELGFIDMDDVKTAMGVLGISKGILLAAAAAAVIGIAVILIIPLFVTKNKDERLSLYTSLFFIAAMTAPLIFANGGHYYLFTFRLYFAQYVMLALFVMQILFILGRNKSEALKKGFTALTLVLLCALTAFNVYLYGGIHKIDVAKESYIAEQLESGADSIEVVLYPQKYNNFIYSCNDFKLAGWAPRFDDYYGIDRSTPLYFISYNQYLEKTDGK